MKTRQKQYAKNNTQSQRLTGYFIIKRNSINLIGGQPPGFNALWTKAWSGKGTVKNTVPMLQSPVTALRLLPSIALSSELVQMEYQDK